MNPEPVPGAPGDADDLLRAAHARLLPADALTPDIAGSLRYARPVADGLVLAYALDLPGEVRILTDPDVERCGREELRQAAYENLMRVPVTHEEIPCEGTVLHSFYGDSHFVSSKALFLAAAVREVTGASLPHAGALVVVPSRHNLVYHPLADGTVADAVNHLAAYALGAFQDGPGALSPRVYWWHRGGLTSLTVVDEDSRTFSVRPPARLLDLMRGLVRLDGAGRLATRAAAEAPAPDPDRLARTTADALTALGQDPAAGPGDAFGSAVALAHARCAADPGPRGSTRGTPGAPPHSSAAPCSPGPGRRTAGPARTSSGGCRPCPPRRPPTPAAGSTPSTWRSCAGTGSASGGCARRPVTRSGRTRPWTRTSCTGSTPCGPTSPRGSPWTRSWRVSSRPCGRPVPTM